MASGTTRPNGDEWVFFRFHGKRQTVRLGPIGKKAREEFQRRLERLIATTEAGFQPDVELRQWLQSMAPKPYGLLARTGLAAERSAFTIAQLFDWHIDQLQKSGAKPSTIRNIRRVRANAVECLRGDRHIGTVRPSDADELFGWMLECGKHNGKPLERTTVSRRIARAGEVFRAAVKRGWISSNPFDHIKREGEVNRSRDEYIPWDTVLTLINLETTAEVRLFLALARVCGLRCPSELVPLTWDAFEWPLNIFHVEAPKTGPRDIPIFLELEPYLRAAWTASAKKSGLIFPNLQVANSSITDRLQRLCRLSKISLWTKPWVNMRASAEQDMFKVLPLHEATAYLGHSPETALRHYNRVAKELRARAQGRALLLPDFTWEVKQNRSFIGLQTKAV